MWVALFWTALCSLTLAFSLFSSPKLCLNFSKGEWRNFAPAISLILFQLWGLLQIAFLAPDKTASLNQSLIGIGFVLLLTIWLANTYLKNTMGSLFISVLVFATVQAGYGLWIFLSDTELLLWMPKLFYLDRPTGFFVNANHFAAYIVLAIILCLSNTIANSSRLKQRGGFASLFETIYSPKLIIMGFLFISLIASKSIGAILALTIVVGLMFLNIIRKSQHKVMIISTFIGLVLIAAIALLSIDYSIIQNEVNGLAHTFSRRFELSKAAFNMLQDNWLFGIGGGAFYSQFSQYRTLDIGNTYYNYAHNDWLQFWIEYGLIGISMLTLFIIAIIRDNIKVLKANASSMQKTFAYASLYSIIAVAIHSLVDFPLHIPGFTALFLVIISINSLNIMGNTLFKDVDRK